ncbi:hypothetical protein CGZ96_11115 [Enemella evansiae]|nr:hypothetical protein CGZ96_11115 [Enemella evansiae]
MASEGIRVHTWAATPQTRIVPLVVGLAAVQRDDVDVWIAITRDDNVVRWELKPRSGLDEVFHFDRARYDEQLWRSIRDHSWEEPPDRTLRLVRERCDHAWLKSQGLRWKWASARRNGQLWIALITMSTLGLIADYSTERLDHADPDVASARALEGLYGWVKRGAPGPRLRDGSGDPDSIAGIDYYARG